MAKGTCQKDILEMILDSFHSKFAQKYFGIQSIIHLNDLHLMRQTTFKAEEALSKLFELSHPYYYAEYYPQGSDHLQQICSLIRLSSYANACHRIKLYQSLKQFDGQSSIDSILYLDHQYLLLDSKELHETHLQNMKLPTCVKLLSQNDVIGKYNLVLKGQDEEMDRYLQYFEGRQRQNEELGRVKIESSAAVSKNYGLYKLMVKSSNGAAALSEEQMIENYVKLILSDPNSQYQVAPNIEPIAPKTKHSQRHTHHDKSGGASIGISPEQSNSLKNLLIKALGIDLTKKDSEKIEEKKEIPK